MTLLDSETIARLRELDDLLWAIECRNDIPSHLASRCRRLRIDAVMLMNAQRATERSKQRSLQQVRAA